MSNGMVYRAFDRLKLRMDECSEFLHSSPPYLIDGEQSGAISIYFVLCTNGQTFGSKTH